jgi:hypothetical protein
MTRDELVALARMAIVDEDARHVLADALLEAWHGSDDAWAHAWAGLIEVFFDERDYPGRSKIWTVLAAAADQDRTRLVAALATICTKSERGPDDPPR